MQLMGDANYIYRVTATFVLVHCKNLERNEMSELFSEGCKKL